MAEHPIDSATTTTEPAVCSVCLEEFKDPKILPCCHTYCSECLEKLVTKSEAVVKAAIAQSVSLLSGFGVGGTANAISCPQCRVCHNIPQGGVRAFLTDYSVVQDQEKRQWCRNFALNRNRCGECEQDGATVSFCEDCESFLCSYCAGAHKRMKAFSSHQLSSLPSSPNLLPHLPLKSKSVTCIVHPEKSASFYCATCSQLICNECVAVGSGDLDFSKKTVTIHRSHILYTVSDESLETLSAKLDKLIMSMSTDIKESQEKLDLIEKVEEKMSSHHKQLKKSLEDVVEKYIEDIRAQCKHDLKQMDVDYAAKVDKYKAKKSAVKEGMGKIKVKRQFARKALDCAGKVPKVAMVAHAVSLLEKSATFGIQQPLLLPATTFNLETVNVENISRPPLVVRDVATYMKKDGLFRPVEGHDFSCQVKNVQPDKSTSESMLGTLSAFPSFPGSWIAKAKLELRSKAQVTIEVSVQPVGTPKFRVKYGRSERTLKINVHSQQEGTWLLEFTPCCLGAHKIEICVHGYWITSGVPEFTVTGKLKEGDIVCRTPDSNSTVQEFVAKEDIKNSSLYEEGRLTKVTETRSRSHSSTLYDFYVTWGHNSEKPLVERMSFRSFSDSCSGIPLELAL